LKTAIAAAALLLLTALPAHADPVSDVVAGSPHSGMNHFVYCEVNGRAAYIEGEDWPKRSLWAEEIEGMKRLCVREAMYGGRGADYWSLPVTEADLAASRFVVYMGGR
jgi:hypothetical protein